MARIPMIQEDDPAAPPGAREFLQRIKGITGEEPFNSVRLWANHPERGSALISLARVARDQSGPSRTLKELAWSTASALNECYY